MNRRLLLMALALSPVSFAGPINSELLIKSCQEFVSIYDRRGEKRLLAAVSTSVAEAMRAGICRGMLEEHMQHRSYGCAGVYDQAVFIAQQSPSDYQYSRESLLNDACQSR